jgi:hypothetical protein
MVGNCWSGVRQLAWLPLYSKPMFAVGVQQAVLIPRNESKLMRSPLWVRTRTLVISKQSIVASRTRDCEAVVMPTVKLKHKDISMCHNRLNRLLSACSHWHSVLSRARGKGRSTVKIRKRLASETWRINARDKVPSGPSILLTTFQMTRLHCST